MGGTYLRGLYKGVAGGGGGGGEVPKLLSPDLWLKERGIYIRIALFCIMAERTLVSLLSGTT